MAEPRGIRLDWNPMRLWIVGPAGGGKSALLARLRDYIDDRAQPAIRFFDLPAGAARPVLEEGEDFAIAQRGEGLDLTLDDGRMLYVARAAVARPVPAPPVAAEVWLVPEGEQSQGMFREPFFINHWLQRVGGTLTLLPEVFPALAQAPERQRARASYVQRRLQWGFTYLELRDDLLDDGQLAAAAALIPGARRLVSARRQRSGGTDAAGSALRAAAAGAALWDWPLELGPVPDLGLSTPRVASLHTRLLGESLAAAIGRLEAADAGATLLKLAVPVHDLAELGFGHAWVQRDPGRHQFLPSCPRGSGRWSWYRLWRGRGQQLNFVRERAASGTAPSADQPTLYEWLLGDVLPAVPGGGPPFAALLGDPVAHSRTPAEQRMYFQARNQRGGWPTLLITVTAADLQVCEPLTVLGELGLRAAAVTAPRKHDARAWLDAAGGTFVVSDARDPTSVCNTLGRSASGAWFGTNTDGIGLRAGWLGLCAEHPALATARIALWGGGGTQELLRSAFPQAVAYAARTGQPRPGETVPAGAAPESEVRWTPDVVVWAVGRSRQPDCAWPSPDWRPRYVFDLNYSDDSPGREYAARCGAQYESGLRFFQAQAAAQRQFWDDVLK